MQEMAINVQQEGVIAKVGHYVGVPDFRQLRAGLHAARAPLLAGASLDHHEALHGNIAAAPALLTRSRYLRPPGGERVCAASPALPRAFGWPPTRCPGKPLPPLLVPPALHRRHVRPPCNPSTAAKIL